MVVEVAVSDLPHRRLVPRHRRGAYVREDVVQDEAVVAAGCAQPILVWWEEGGPGIEF